MVTETEGAIPEEIYTSFWDVDPRTLNLTLHSEFVISRILEYTTPAALHWIEKTYDRQEILNVNERSRKISDRSKNFWCIWYGVTS
ncbi:MAG: DUF6922 domain-containing protein [Gammaproteobacteria bacterium]